MTDDIRSVISRSSLLKVLESSERERLIRAGRIKTYRKGCELFLEGDPCNEIHVLLSGRVRLWCATSDGHVLAYRICGAGEVLGQMSALEESDHSVSATTMEAVKVLLIPQSAFRKMIETQPALAAQLAKVLAQRVRALSHDLEAMKFSSISERVVQELRDLGHSRREVRITHQALADRVGATRENVSRVLGLLRDRGILRLRRGTIEIIDPQGISGVLLEK